MSDSKISGNCKEKEKSQLRNKASTDSSSKYFKENAQNHWKKHSTKNSILSLQISTYENSVKAKPGSFGDKINESNKLKINEQQNAKQIFTASKFVIQNPFEFSRQQSDKTSKPEVSQFKASQRLFNPNKASNKVHQMTLRSRKKNNQEELEVEVEISVNASEKIRSKAEEEGELMMEELSHISITYPSQITSTQQEYYNDGENTTIFSAASSFNDLSLQDPFDEDTRMIEPDPYDYYEPAIFKEERTSTTPDQGRNEHLQHVPALHVRDNPKVQPDTRKPKTQLPTQIPSSDFPPVSSKARKHAKPPLKNIPPTLSPKKDSKVSHKREKNLPKNQKPKRNAGPSEKLRFDTNNKQNPATTTSTSDSESDKSNIQKGGILTPTEQLLSLANQTNLNESAVSTTETTTSSPGPSGFTKEAKQMLAEKYLAEGNIINHMLADVYKKSKNEKKQKKH